MVAEGSDSVPMWVIEIPSPPKGIVGHRSEIRTKAPPGIGSILRAPFARKLQIY